MRAIHGRTRDLGRATPSPAGTARTCRNSPSPARLGCASPTRIDPVEALGIQPDKPLPYWGWGDIPDQYRRRWEDDDGQSPMPPDPGLADLPSLQPHWGRAASAQGRD